jgi:hypothetical protein
MRTLVQSYCVTYRWNYLISAICSSQFRKYTLTILGTVLLKVRYMNCWLTSDDQTTLGGTQSCFSGKAMFCSTLIRLITIFWPNITYMKLSRWQHQVLSICKHITPLYLPQFTHRRQRWHRLKEHSVPSWTVRKLSLSITSAYLTLFPQKNFYECLQTTFMVITNELTPQSWVLLLKLTIVQLVKKFPEFYETHSLLCPKEFVTGPHESITEPSTLFLK